MTNWNKCPSCGITTNSVSCYCPNCGEPWTIECVKCSRTWRFWESNRFCPYCGAPAEKHGVAMGKPGRVETKIGKPRARV
jgi:predicted amidophosphoribosyltransferase